MNLDIVFHFVEFDQLSLESAIDDILGQIVNGIVLNLQAPMQDVTIGGCPEQSNLVLEVVD